MAFSSLLLAKQFVNSNQKEEEIERERKRKCKRDGRGLFPFLVSAIKISCLTSMESLLYFVGEAGNFLM